MNAEMKFSQFLGSMPTTSMQKTAQAMEQLSIDELETLLRGEIIKEAAGRKKVRRAKFDADQGRASVDEAKKVTPLSNKASRGEAPIQTPKTTRATSHASAPTNVAAKAGGPSATAPKAGGPAATASRAATLAEKSRGLSRGAKFGLGALGVAGAGALAAHAYKKKQASFEYDFEDFQEKVAMADDMGRSIAQQTFEKLSFALSPGMMGTLGKGVNAVMGAGHGTRAAVGAAGGAALGAAKNVVAPQRDASGNPIKGGVMQGALRGAVGGAALGLAAKPALRMVGNSQTGVGQTIRNASAGATAAATAKAVPANKMLGAAPANNMFTPEAIAARKAQQAAPQVSTISGSEGVGEVRKIKRPTSGPGSVQKGAPPPGGQTINMN